METHGPDVRAAKVCGNIQLSSTDRFAYLFVYAVYAETERVSSNLEITYSE